MTTLAVVVAHPDDDAYDIPGTVALHADDEDFRFVLVHATDGEAGDIHPDFDATPQTLGAIRRAEDEAAWRAVGCVPARHEWLGFPDGGVAGVPFADAVEAVSKVLAQEQPTVVITFGPDGVSGHPDHIAIGAATDAAFARGVRSASPSSVAFRRLLHVALPESTFLRWNEQRAVLGLPVFDPTRLYHLRGVPDASIGIEVDCRAVAERTVAGILEHRSQAHLIFDQPIDVTRWRRIVSREWFVIAWPPRAPAGAPTRRLTDIFEGLQ